MWQHYALFPAHAGVIPSLDLKENVRVSFPRPRGGDPYMTADEIAKAAFFPPTRG